MRGCRLPHTSECRNRFASALRSDRRVQASERRANEFYVSIVEADGSKRETEKRQRGEGDFQNDPRELVRSAFAKIVGATIKTISDCPKQTYGGTCKHTSTSGAHEWIAIDYFLVSDGLSDWSDSLLWSLNVLISPPRGLHLRIPCALRATTVLVLSTPKPSPRGEPHNAHEGFKGSSTVSWTRGNTPSENLRELYTQFVRRYEEDMTQRYGFEAQEAKQYIGRESKPTLRKTTALRKINCEYRNNSPRGIFLHWLAKSFREIITLLAVVVTSIQEDEEWARAVDWPDTLPTSHTIYLINGSRQGPNNRPMEIQPLYHMILSMPWI